jgi:Spy/CpxP family protein refolding chaperone
MARQFAWILVAALVCAPSVVSAERACEQPQQGSRQSEQRRPRFVKWWDEPKHRAELGITDQQSARIEQIFQSTLAEQRTRWREFEQIDRAVSVLIKEGTADPSVVEQQVGRCEDLRAALNKTRVLTLYRMHRELTTDQRARLKAMEERREADHRRSSDSGRRQ